MAQQLAMDTAEVTVRDLKEFLAAVEDLGISLNTPLKVTTISVPVPDEEKEEGVVAEARISYKFSIPIPESKRRRIVKVKKTKKEKAVEEQIKEHKEEVKKGKKVAHVPPVKGTVKRKTKKRRVKKEEEPKVEGTNYTESQLEEIHALHQPPAPAPDPDLPDEVLTDAPEQIESHPAKKKSSKKGKKK